MKNGQMNASAYVQDNRLCIIGICTTPIGAIPFSHAIACEAENGPVDFGAELPEAVRIAIANSQGVISKKVEQEKIRLAAEEIVDRINAGDQNARALMLAAVQNAKRGYPRAIFSVKCMMRYGKNPSRMMGETTSTALAKEIASDQPLHVQTALNGILPGMRTIQAVVTLANGPELDNTRITSMVNGLSNDEKRDFASGFKTWKDKSNVKTMGERIGKCVGYARAIQLVRKPNTSISVLSNDAAWELE
jgi:hypothetical protein